MLWWIVGADLYGKVDRVPEVCHVGTRFLHIMFFPMVPTGSYLVLESEAHRESNIAHKIRWSWKPVGLAYMRAFLVVTIMASWGVGCEILFDARNRPGTRSLAFMGLGFGTVLLGVYLLTLLLGRPTARRREYLLQLAAKAQAMSHEHGEWHDVTDGPHVI